MAVQYYQNPDGSYITMPPVAMATVSTGQHSAMMQQSVYPPNGQMGKLPQKGKWWFKYFRPSIDWITIYSKVYWKTIKAAHSHWPEIKAFGGRDSS